MMGININCKHTDWISMILRGDKTIETRNSRSLHPYIGQRVALIRTGKGKARVMGYATIIGCYHYLNRKQFDNDWYYHRVDSDDAIYGFKDEKFGYILEDVEYEFDIKYVTSKGIVARKI